MLDESALDLQLEGGEDYVLLFTLPAATKVPSHLGATRIGRVTDAPGLRLRLSDGEVRPLEPRGWDHLARTDSRVEPRISD